MNNVILMLTPKTLRKGMKIGHLTLLYKTELKRNSVNTRICWRAQCSCGTRLTVPQNYLCRVKPKTHCGCQNKTDKTIYNQEYRIWLMMRKRCSDENHIAYKHYGGRGIKVCDAWWNWENGFTAFLKDVGARPSKGHSIDRINVDGNYEPGNVRWATAKEQAANKRPRK